MECAEYFRSQAGYRRCFEELLKKWMSYGRPAGIITLENASEEERRLLGGILGKTFYDSKIRFSFADFERGLQRTRFAPVDMKKLLESYFGKAISTNQEEKERKRQARDRFFEELYASFADNTGKDAAGEMSGKMAGEMAEEISGKNVGEIGAETAAHRWIRQMMEDKAWGFWLLAREFAKDEKAARELGENTGRALQELFPVLPGRETEESPEAFQETVLAVFAAKICGNPHYFDRGTPGGQLLANGICCIMGQALPENAHQWKELLLRAGIAPDYVSSMVHAYGIGLKIPEGRHPALEAFRVRREACVITLENLRNAVGAWAPGKRVFVVENEMVFSFLTEQLRGRDADVGLLCTSGQLRTAAVKLLELFAGAGYRIWYSGDMDPEGIEIADRLWKRFKGSGFDGGVEIWRMSPEDYGRGISGEVLKESRLTRLDKVEHPVLKETADCVREKKRAAYQENILEALLGDLLSAED